MLKSLHVSNFTVFADARFEFSPGLNVLVGTNGTGKTHVLKLGYAVEFAREQMKNADSSKLPLGLQISENRWIAELFYNLPQVFQTASFENLGANNSTHQITSAKIEFLDSYSLDKLTEPEALIFEIDPDASGIRIKGGGEVTSHKIPAFAPVFIPAKELLTLSWMLPASEQLALPVERNYLDLLTQLRGLPRRQPASPASIAVLTQLLGGEVKEEGDKYYLTQADGRRLEVSMVAEGLRKFGMLQKLLINGSLTPQTTLYWDEPEANLNPALLRELARVLAELARQGFQIILATHSMSLLKQFHILSREPHGQPLPIRYFGLNAEPGQATVIHTVDDFELLPHVVALEVELAQADDLEEIFAREDRLPDAANR